MPRLIVTDANHERREFPISSGMTIGRQSGNHIQIEEKKASRTHCRVRPEGKDIFIEDLGSSNGTKVNGLKVSKHQLRNGDLVMIGGTTIVFEDENAPPPPKPKAAPKEEEADEDGGLTVALTAVQVKEMDKKTIKRESKDRIASKSADVDDKDVDVDEEDESSDDHDPNETSGSLEAARPSQAVRATEERRRAQAKQKLKHTIVNAVLVLVFVGVVLYVITNKDKFTGETKVAVEPVKPVGPVVPPPVRTDVKVGDVIDTAPPPVKVTTPDPAAIKTEPDANAIAEELNKVLAERDRSMASSNFLGAKLILSQFIANHPAAPVTERAKQELKDTEKLIDTALNVAIEDARRAAIDKKYRVATQRCTRLMSSDPQGKYGAEAQKILKNNDLQTEPRYKELNGQADMALKAGNLDKMAESLGKILEELGGTKWAAAASSDQVKVIMARGLLKQLDTERLKREAKGEKIPIKIAKKWLKGDLAKITGLVIDVKTTGSGTLQFPLKTLESDEFEAVLEAAGLPNNHLEQAYLWLLADRKDSAQAQVEKALQDPQQAAEATRLASLVANLKNLKAYDFSKWQHQLDWDALSGSWSTQDDRYVLESAEGGDTTLRKDAIGGSFAAKGARISFDFEPQNPGPGMLFAMEFGEDDSHTVGMIFTSEGVTLNSTLGAAVSEKDSWKSGPTHVDLAVKGDDLSVAINGKAIKTLKVDGLGAATGTVTFRVRDSACAIDNVILRNVE